MFKSCGISSLIEWLPNMQETLNLIPSKAKTNIYRELFIFSIKLFIFYIELFKFSIKEIFIENLDVVVSFCITKSNKYFYHFCKYFFYKFCINYNYIIYHKILQFIAYFPTKIWVLWGKEGGMGQPCLYS